jgi:hypothetical protein
MPARPAVPILVSLAAVAMAFGGCGGSAVKQPEAGVAEVTSACREAEERFVDITNRDLPSGQTSDLAPALQHAAGESAAVDHATSAKVRAVALTASDRSIVQTALARLAHSESALAALGDELHAHRTKATSTALLARFLADDGGCLAPGQEVGG